MDFLGGSDIQFQVTLQRQGEPLMPDTNSVRYTVYDHAGVAIPALTNVVGGNTFYVSVALPALYTAIDPAKRFERRTVMVSCTVQGQPHRQREQIRLIPFLNMSVTPAEVRGFIGLQERELPDASIDLLAAYLVVEKDISAVELEAALSAGTTTELAANECIRMQAVLDVLPSVRQRIAQGERNGIMGFERAEIRDFREIEFNARSRYASARRDVLGTVEEQYNFVLVTQDADPITG